MIRLADYLARFLVGHGIDTVFMITGGGAMHLDDALGQAEGLRYVCNQHEQACAIAAEGYARLSGRIAAVCVTTGPGGTNALTGVLGQWLDSIPAIYISGQVRYDTTVASTGLPLRQFGDQEADIVTIVRSITKYAVMVTDPTGIRYHLEKALHLARSGRPGPVWLDIPLNVQAAQVDEASLRPYDPAEDGAGDSVPAGGSRMEEQVAETISRLRAAQRPVLLAGAGVRLAGAEGLLLKAARRLSIPLQAAWDAIDLAPTDHPLYAGRPSSLGQRGANFIFQNADLLLSLGCRLNVRQIGYNFATVARAAYKIAVDIDPLELQKPSLKIDLPVVGDARLFLEELLRQLGDETLPFRLAWLEWCRERLRRYPPVPPEPRPGTRGVDPYQFCQMLGELLGPGEVVVSANGAACVVPIQAMGIRAGQRHIVNSGCAAMGYGLPAAIGAAFANRGRGWFAWRAMAASSSTCRSSRR